LSMTPRLYKSGRFETGAEREEYIMGKTTDLLGQILTHGPSQNTIFFALTKMKEEGLFSEIIQECLKALNVFPDDIRIRNLLAESYLETGFISLAEEELHKVASEIEKMTPVFMRQARMYIQQNKPEKAITPLKKYLALNPGDQEATDLYNEIAPAETVTTLEAPPLEEATMEGVTEQEQSEAEPAEEVIEESAEAEAAEPVPEEELLEEIAAPEPEEKDLSEKEYAGIVEDEAEAAEVEGEEIVDLATPTLAELYFSQGQIQEAIETYEKILLNDPEDEKSGQRLDELKASLDKEAELPSSEESEKDDFHGKTEKSISILENWLAQLQKKN